MSRALLLAFLAALLLFPNAARAGVSDVVVSQIYGGGGNAGATFGTTTSSCSTPDPAPSTCRAGRCSTPPPRERPGRRPHFRGRSRPAATTWSSSHRTRTSAPSFRPADATGTSNLGGTSGKIALVRGAAALTCGASAGSCSADPLVEDLVGYGSASDFEGAGSAAGLSNTSAALRANDGCTDTGDNATDFAAAAPRAPELRLPAELVHGHAFPGPSGSVNVDLDVASVLSVSLDRPALSFGTFTSGDRPGPLPERVTVSSNNTTGYSLVVARTAFAPTDLPLALSATAPAGGTLGGALTGGALVPIPISPATGLTVGTKATPSAAGGDVWATNIGFSSALPLVATGRYTATVTFTAVAR